MILKTLKVATVLAYNYVTVDQTSKETMLLCYLHTLDTNKTLKKENGSINFKLRKRQIHNTLHGRYWWVQVVMHIIHWLVIELVFWLLLNKIILFIMMYFMIKPLGFIG